MKFFSILLTIFLVLVLQPTVIKAFEVISERFIIEEYLDIPVNSNKNNNIVLLAFDNITCRYIAFNFENKSNLKANEICVDWLLENYDGLTLEDAQKYFSQYNLSHENYSMIIM